MTDATWHHFVNINLTGIVGLPSSDPLSLGFLASASGQAAYEDIKSYFRNLAVWLSPPERIACMNSRLLWWAVWNERVLESVLTSRNVGIQKTSARTLSLIGKHARDVLGRFAGRCQSAKLLIDLIEVRDPLYPWIDPWRPFDKKDPVSDDYEIPVFDSRPMLDAALGGALVAIAEAYKEPSPELIEKLEADQVLKIARKGASVGLDKARESLRTGFGRVDEVFFRSQIELIGQVDQRQIRKPS